MGEVSPTALSLLIPPHTMSDDALPETPPSFFSPHSEHFALTLYLSRYVNPSPFIRHLYTVSNWVPSNQKGWQTISIVLPKLVLSPTLPKIPVRVSNALYKQPGSVDMTRP